MTKLQFTYNMPDIITHQTLGYGELEFIQLPSKDNRVGVQYRHENRMISHATIKANWQKLYDDLFPYLQSIKGDKTH